MTNGSRFMATRATRVAAAAVLALTMSGCRQDMHDAPRYDPLEASTVLAKGASAQPLVEGTVARGHLNDDVLLHTGKVDGKPADLFPFAIARTDLDRGEQRFNIYCAPCHGKTGDGNGMVVQRGYRQAASMHIDRLRTVQAGYIFDVITNGYGAMKDYKGQIPVEDRWRIVAYIRALQMTRTASPADIPAAEMQRMNAPPPAPAPVKAGGHGGE